MTSLEQRYGLLTPEDADLSGAWGIILTLKQTIALLQLFIVPDFTVQDYVDAVSSPNYSNDSQVGRIW